MTQSYIWKFQSERFLDTEPLTAVVGWGGRAEDVVLLVLELRAGVVEQVTDGLSQLTATAEQSRSLEFCLTSLI